MASGSKTVVVAALGANAVIAVAKLGVGLLTGSAALLAEAAHSAADTVNQGFLLVGINLSDNPADEDHPYGHGKERFFWAFLAAIFIFVAGALFSIYEGTRTIVQGSGHHGELWPAFLVLGLAFVFDGAVLVLGVREALHQAHEMGTGFLGFIRESTDVTLKTALYEDIAATTGVVFAVAGLILVEITGNSLYDGLASIMIGLTLVVVAVLLGRQTRDLLLGSAASKRTRTAIRSTIGEFPEVEVVVDLLTMQLGLNSVLVTGQLDIRDGLTTDQIEDLLARITRQIRAAAPEVQNVYLEPRSVSSAAAVARRQAVAGPR